MKRNLLFVTYKDGEIDEGLNYALDLAKMTDKGMAVLLVNKKKLSRKLEDIMSAAAYAEENEPAMAQQIMRESGKDVQTAIEAKCKTSGIAAAVHTAFQDAATSLKDFLRQNTSIDMVLLSPTITENGNISSRELSKLVKTASRPIVTMAKQPHIA